MRRPVTTNRGAPVPPRVLSFTLDHFTSFNALRSSDACSGMMRWTGPPFHVELDVHHVTGHVRLAEIEAGVAVTVAHQDRRRHRPLPLAHQVRTVGAEDELFARHGDRHGHTGRDGPIADSDDGGLGVHQARQIDEDLVQFASGARGVGGVGPFTELVEVDQAPPGGGFQQFDDVLSLLVGDPELPKSALLRRELFLVALFLAHCSDARHRNVLRDPGESLNGPPRERLKSPGRGRVRWRTGPAPPGCAVGVSAASTARGSRRCGAR